MRVAPFLLCAVLLAAGCAEPSTHRLSGSFTEDRTDADLDEVSRLGREHGADVAILESFPEQFVASGMTAEACDDLRAALADKPYLASLGDCEASAGGGRY